MPNHILEDYVKGGEYDEKVKEYLNSNDDDRELDSINVDGEDYAYQPPGTKEIYPYMRPAWEPGTFEKIRGVQMAAGKLICAICGNPIELNFFGKEVWKSKGNKLHSTRPPIDHDSPGWIVRLGWVKEKVEKEYGPGALLTLSQKVEVREWVKAAYHNKKPFKKGKLQIAHMKCNSGKAKESFS